MNQFVSASRGSKDFGLRWQSVAATPLLQPLPAGRKRRGAALPAAVQNCGLRRCRVALIAIVLIAFGLAFSPLRTSAQIVGPWGHGAALPFLQGPTLADTLRNGAQAASDQSRVTAQFANEISQRARGAGYQMQNFSADLQNLVYQFQNLRYTFSAVGQLALQLQTPRAANAAAELEAGLNIISEAFTPMQQEMQAGTFNPDTIQRMCGAINQALLEWQKELKKCSARLGMLR